MSVLGSSGWEQLCFLGGAHVNCDGGSRGACKLSGKSFEKGQVRFVATTGSTKVNISLEAAAEFLPPVVKAAKDFKPENWEGKAIKVNASFNNVAIEALFFKLSRMLDRSEATSWLLLRADTVWVFQCTTLTGTCLDSS